MDRHGRGDGGHARRGALPPAPAHETREWANALPLLVWVADADARIRFANARAADYDTGQVCLGCYPVAVHADDAARLSGACQQALARGEPFEIEHRVRTASGEYRWMRSRAVPTRRSDGRITGWYGSSTDVHERRRSGERLNEAAQQHRQLLSIVGHELRNPLAPVRTSLAALRVALARGVLDRRLLESLCTLMERHTGHLARLLDGLLELERIDRGQIRLQREDVALSAVIACAVEATRPQFDAAGHRLTLDLASAPALVRADPVQLTQVFTNLLGNAAKYTPPGGQVELTAWRSRDHVVIRVCDDGVGMARDLVPRVFDLFLHPAPAHGATAPHGLGIGLTLVKRLVELHGGTVAAVSEGPGQGSEFRVALPIGQDDGQPHCDDEADGARPRAAARRVLIADDNEDAGETLALMLGMLGHDVRTTTNGVDALVIAEAFRPALVCLDVGMPGLDGLAAARAIRSKPWGKDPLLVAMTGFSQEEDRQKTSEAGFDLHLVKPVDPVEIIRLLDSLGPR